MVASRLFIIKLINELLRKKSNSWPLRPRHVVECGGCASTRLAVIAALAFGYSLVFLNIFPVMPGTFIRRFV